MVPKESGEAGAGFWGGYQKKEGVKGSSIVFAHGPP